MPRLRRPGRGEIEAFLATRPLAPSYAEVGATARLDVPAVREDLIARYDLDRYEFSLGRGRDLFGRARACLLAWQQFRIPWLEFHGADRVVPDQVVATLASVAGLWFLSPCRVVYVDAPPESDSASYAYGTLPGHPERGEERFTVCLDPITQEVRYRIAAFSRPATLLSRVGYPIARRLQRRFAAASAEALTRAAA